MAKRKKYKQRSYWLDVKHGICPNCGEKGPHFMPPSLGDPGLFICQERERVTVALSDDDPSVLTDDQPHWCTSQGVPHMPTPECSTRAVGRMGLSGNVHVRPTDEAIAEQQRMTEAYYADPDV